MLINFKKIELENFMPFEYASVVLNKDGYTMISGKNENPDDNAKSNGAGKSSILEGLCWTLLGETVRGTKDVKRFGSTGTCKGTLEFDVDGISYKIVRTKDPSNLFIYINGEDKSGKGIRDTSVLLAEYLPDLTPQLLGSVVVLGQGLPMRFTNNSPSGRKEVLEKLSKSDFMIEELKTKVTKRKTTLQTQKRQTEDSLISKETIVNTKTQDITRSKAELKTLESMNYDDAINLANNSIESCNENIQSWTVEQQKVQDEINNLNELNNKKFKEKVEEQNSLNTEYNPKIDEKNSELSELKSQIAVLNSKINSIKNIKTHCPTCGQPLVGVEKPDPAPLESDLAILNTNYSTKSAELMSIRQELQSKLNEISQKYVASDSEYNTKSLELKRSLQTISQNLSKCNMDLNSAKNSLNTALVQKKNHEYKIEQAQNDINEATQVIQRAQTEIATLKDELNDSELHLNVISKFENALKRDFRGILLGNIINYIDSKSKEYSQIVFGTDKLDFVLDGNNINITYCNKAYENLSGGEKQKIDLIVQFALRDMLCKYLNFSSNILFLDEIMDNLDSFGCQKVMDLISQKLNDVSSIYIISHHSDIPLPIDYELNIIKDKDGISHVGND